MTHKHDLDRAFDVLTHAAELRDEFRENYRGDPQFRAQFNRYLLTEFGIRVVPDDEPRTPRH